jgi:hypothetical protein
MKRCSKCKLEKDVSEFTKNKSRSDGLALQCKSCIKTGYDQHKHRYREKQKEYRKENRESIRVKNRERYSLEKSREYGNSLKGKFSSYKSNAKQRDISFNITFEEFTEFWGKPCTYCGDDIDTVGIDRVDSGKGYIVSNLTACCTECNLMKRHHSRDFFIKKLKRIIRHTGDN